MRELRCIAVHRGERRGRLIDVIVERARLERACTGHVLGVGVPQRVEPHAAFLALARRHVAARELIGVALECAGAEHVDVHAELVDGVLQKHAVVAEAVDVHEPERIQIHLARLRREIVLALIERIAHRHHALAGSAEIAQSRADLLQFRQARGGQVAEIQHDQLDARVALRGLDGVDHIAQQGFRGGPAGGLSESTAHRIARQLLDQLAFGRNHEGGAARHGGNGCMQRREHESENDQQ